MTLPTSPLRERERWLHFRKVRRAQSIHDFETWQEDAVTNTINTFDTGDVRSTDVVVHPIQATVIGRSDEAGPQGRGFGDDTDPMFTLNTADRHAIAFGHKQGIDIQASEDATPTLRANGDGAAVMSSAVRRLTPLECERLQGFPDGWTAERYDYKKQQVVPQADSARYKQMGNAVAVPVFAWVMGRLAAAHANALPANEEGAA